MFMGSVVFWVTLYISILFLNLLKPLAFTPVKSSIYLVSFVENVKCLISDLHCSFVNITSCLLVLLSVLSDTEIFLSVCSIF